MADRADEIRDAVAAALARTGAVITTGGLGPTRDDITKKIVADLFDAPLEFDETIWAALLARFARAGRAPVQSNRSQAEVPRGATVLPNRWGTAPGLWLEGAPGLVIMLPGVPLRDAKATRARGRSPARRARSGGTVIRSLVVRTTGIPESTLAERMGEIEQDVAPLSLAYLPGLEGVDLRLTRLESSPRRGGSAPSRGARDCCTSAPATSSTAKARSISRRWCSMPRADAGLRIGAAESCTGGLVGERLTEIPGSSDVFIGGVVALRQRAQDFSARRARGTDRGGGSRERGGRARDGGGRDHAHWASIFRWP